MCPPASAHAVVTEELVSAEPRMNEVGLTLGDFQVVQFWERPLMRQLAEFAGRAIGRQILEIGYGTGMCSEYIQSKAPSEHVIVEANRHIARRAQAWAATHSATIRVVQDSWQSAIPALGRFDSVVFDAAPLVDTPHGHYEEFLPFARALTRVGGCFTYISLEARLTQHHLALLSSFARIEVAIVKGLRPSKHCTYWSGAAMSLPCVTV